MRTLAQGEVRSALGGVGIHHLKALKLPNVLRIQIHGVRGLRQRPKMRPRVIVRVRQLQLQTGEGRPADDKRAAAGGGDTGGDTYFTFDLGAEMLLPLTDPSAVLHIKAVIHPSPEPNPNPNLKPNPSPSPKPRPINPALNPT